METEATPGEVHVLSEADRAALEPTLKRIAELEHEQREQQVDALASEIEMVILDRAAAWEVDFQGGPGQVAGVSDAARVTARWVLHEFTRN